MKRRDSLKTLLVGGIGATGLTVGVTSCKTDDPAAIKPPENIEHSYGRTPAEIEHDERIKSQGKFFTDMEMEQITTLCDLILPATAIAGSASAAEVPAFIDFIVKDIPSHQLSIQGGLMWLNGESQDRFQSNFLTLTGQQQKSILDDIAYESESDFDQYAAGRSFFKKIRNLVLSGYYTTKIGIDDLGYVGNRPNLWDGVPDDVLKKHGFTYDKDMEEKYINHDTRNEPAEWDDKGDLIN